MKKENGHGPIETVINVQRVLFYCPAIFIAVCVLVLPGCLRRSPYETAKRYIENLQQFNYAKCYSLLTAQDRADRPMRGFLTEVPLAPDVSPIWFRPILHVSRFELGDEHRSPDGVTADVLVRVTTPDLPLWERTLDAKLRSDGSASQLAERSLTTGAYPTVTYDDKIFLVKEHRHWRVLAGFAARDRVLERRRRAIFDFYEGRLDQAIAEFNSLVNELKQMRGTGNPGVAARMRSEVTEMNKLKAQTGTVKAYVPQVKLDHVDMGMALERVPAIFGEVTNAGSKPIDQLRLAVAWYQGRGKNLKIVGREEHPIIVTPIEFTDFTRAVVPFLPGEKRRFGFILNAPPQVQQSATPYVNIASLALTESPAPLPRFHAVSGSKLRNPDGDQMTATNLPPPLSRARSSNPALAAGHPVTSRQAAADH